ncbi:MAG: hypothetical protein ACI9WU_000902 [Myxococcota bacterium]|jgi:hypothetical protein
MSTTRHERRMSVEANVTIFVAAALLALAWDDAVAAG